MDNILTSQILGLVWRWRWYSKGSSHEDENSIHAPSATRWFKVISLDVPCEKEVGCLNLLIDKCRGAHCSRPCCKDIRFQSNCTSVLSSTVSFYLFAKQCPTCTCLSRFDEMFLGRKACHWSATDMRICSTLPCRVLGSHLGLLHFNLHQEQICTEIVSQY